MQNRAKGPVPISDAIRGFLRESGLNARGIDRGVFQAWKKALGAASEHARPVGLRSGELVVEVDSSAMLQELKGFTGEGYRKQVNKLLGSSRVRRVKFRLKS